MKGKRKNNSGITLVALIITIIVLLILAVVAIRAVQGDGIIAHAKNARDQYEQKVAEENTLLSNLAGYITGEINSNENDEDNVKRISFTFEGETFYAEEGMNWITWINSIYKDDRFVVDSSFVYYSSDLSQDPGTHLYYDKERVVSPSDKIIGEYNYVKNSSGQSDGGTN